MALILHLDDFRAIREQTRAVMQEPRRLDWRTPPSLKSDADDHSERLRKLLEAYRNRRPLCDSVTPTD